MSAIRLCILGCGAVARVHSRVARSLRPRVTLLFASRSLEKARAYNRRFRGAGAFGSYEEACASPDVDAVFICTPQALHLEHARLAARHRKPMLIEKPAARTLAELDEIEAAVAATGTICMVAENYHFKPALRVIRAHVDAGDIGRPLFIELNRVKCTPGRGWRGDAQFMGGGALLEGGVHWVNAMCQLGGEVRSVLAAKPEVPYELVAPFEDSLQVIFRFQSGAVGKLLHSWKVRNRLGGLQLSRIYGEDGNIIFESNGLFALVLGRRRRLRLPGLRDLMGYRAMLAHFIECVAHGTTPQASLATARRDLAIVAAAYRSLHSGCFEPARP